MTEEALTRSELFGIALAATMFLAPLVGLIVGLFTLDPEEDIGKNIDHLFLCSIVIPFFLAMAGMYYIVASPFYILVGAVPDNVD